MDTAEKVGAKTSASTAATWVGAIGLLLIAIGLLGAVIMWSDMGGSGLAGPDYTPIDKWLAVLSALTVTGLGAVTVGVAGVVGRLPDRD